MPERAHPQVCPEPEGTRHQEQGDEGSSSEFPHETEISSDSCRRVFLEGARLFAAEELGIPPESESPGLTPLGKQHLYGTPEQFAEILLEALGIEWRDAPASHHRVDKKPPFN